MKDLIEAIDGRIKEHETQLALLQRARDVLARPKLPKRRPMKRAAVKKKTQPQTTRRERANAVLADLQQLFGKGSFTVKDTIGALARAGNAATYSNANSWLSARRKQGLARRIGRGVWTFGVDVGGLVVKAGWIMPRVPKCGCGAEDDAEIIALWDEKEWLLYWQCLSCHRNLYEPEVVWPFADRDARPTADNFRELGFGIGEK